MTPEMMQLVRSSFDRLSARSDRVATLFYGRLFDLDPTLKPMFSENFRIQRDKLMASFKIIVDHIENLEELASALHKLGARHVSYGVRPDDYETARSALLWTIHQIMGDLFTAELENAWNTAYTLVVTAMNPPR